MMINKKHNDETGEGEIRNIITTRKKNRRSLLERYERRIKEHIVTKLKKNTKYIGIPLERAMEIMDGIKVGGEGEIYPRGDIT